MMTLPCRRILVFLLAVTLAGSTPSGAMGAGGPALPPLPSDPPFPDLRALLGALLLSDETDPGRTYPQQNTAVSASCDFTGVSLRQAALLAGMMQEARWYAPGNEAYRGNRTASLRYSMDTGILGVRYEKRFDVREWPDVLAPDLASLTPVFSRGLFATAEEISLSGCLDTVRLIFTGVGDADISEYRASLRSSGYERRGRADGLEEYTHDTRFVLLDADLAAGTAYITVGKYTVQLVPLPPWPDPLPEMLKRAIPTVHAQTSAEPDGAGFRLAAAGMTLFEVYAFINDAGGYYGWSALTDGGTMANAGLSLVLRIVSYDTESGKLVFFLGGEGLPDTPRP